MLALEWWKVAWGVAVGMTVSTLGLWVAKERSKSVLITAATGVGIGTAVWNTMLNVRQALTVDGDIPFRLFPISWQDVGTGIFSVAVTSVLLLATVYRREPGSKTLKVVGIAAGLAFLFDVYTW